MTESSIMNAIIATTDEPLLAVFGHDNSSWKAGRLRKTSLDVRHASATHSHNQRPLKNLRPTATSPCRSAVEVHWISPNHQTFEMYEIRGRWWSIRSYPKVVIICEKFRCCGMHDKRPGSVRSRHRLISRRPCRISNPIFRFDLAISLLFLDWW